MTTPRDHVHDVVHLLKTAHGAVATAIETLEATRHRITLDLADEDVYFVLTEALRGWAADQRHQADNDRLDDPEDPTVANRLRRAEIADALLARIEAP